MKQLLKSKQLLFRSFSGCRFVTKGGLMMIAGWLNEAALEEQTTFLQFSFQVLSHLPLNKAQPLQLSAMVPTVSRLQFYRTSGFDREWAADAEEAEACAIRRALRVARDFGAEDVAVLTDCRNLALLLQQGDFLGTSFGGLSITHDIIHASRSFESVSFHFISRVENSSTHELAQIGRVLAPFVTRDPIEISSILEFGKSIVVSQS